MKNTLIKNKYILISIGIVTALIAALYLTLFYDTGDKNTEAERTDPVIIESNIEILGDDIKISDITDIKAQDTLLEHISNGETGVYTIGDKHYVVLATGGESSCDIEYNIETDISGNKVVHYKISDTPDSEFKQRYKIIEVSSDNIKIEKMTDKTYAASGLGRILVYKYGDTKLVYDLENNRALDSSTLAVDGLYMATYDKGNIIDYQQLNNAELNECTVLNLVKQSKNLYNVKLKSGNTIQIYLDNLNLENGTIVNINVSYDSVLSGFKGVILQ